MDWWWSWLLTFTGVTTFFLAGKKVWWAWHVGLFVNQPIWLIYGIISHQWGFIASTLFYTAVYSKNAYKWTKEHREEKEALYHNPAFDPGMVGMSLGPFTEDRKGVWYTPSDIILTEALHKKMEQIKTPRPWYCPKWFHERYHEIPVRILGGEKIGHISDMEERGDGLFVTGTIDRSTPAGQRMWDIISGPPPKVSIDFDAEQFVEGVTKAEQGLVTLDMKAETLAAVHTYKGMDGEDCQAFTVWQGRELDCEVNAHPANFEHQHILIDAMPPLRIRWMQDGSPIAEEL